VGLGAAVVPIAVGLPSGAVGAVEEVALAGEDEVWLDGEAELIEAVDDVTEIAACVDGPEDAGMLQSAEKGDEVGDYWGMLEMIDEGAVEVCGKEFDHCGNGVD
jgi:hypothetical protein